VSIKTKLKDFAAIAANPKAQLAAYKAAGKKVIGVMPYYVPEELIHAAGMVPMGLWGTNTKTISRAKEYCATFYCSLAQLDMEMLLDGTLDRLDGVITPTMCDTLRPMSQNIKVAVGDKIPAIFFSPPQNRFNDAGREFCLHQYTNVKTTLEKISGAPITDEALRQAITVYNRSRAARRAFVRLAGEHPEAVSAVGRSAVLKAAWFMPKDTYTEKLVALNAELEALPPSKWDGVKVVTSGIICDNPNLLAIFDKNRIAIAADDVAHESRAFRTDVPEGENPMQALTNQWANTGCDSILFEPEPAKHARSKRLIKLVRDSGAQGMILFMTQFCDPEEMDYPFLRIDFDIAGIPLIRLGLDHQMRDFGQIGTSLQAFSDMLDTQ
jgi:bcr-type benzoyl-CoA reductase subunit C